MGIRDIAMLLLGYGCVPLALYDAYHWLLAYCWPSFMRPQLLVWSPTVQATRKHTAQNFKAQHTVARLAGLYEGLVG